MGKLAPGDPVPPFSLVCYDGKLFDLGAERGRFVVLFFYPQDDTETCTVENRQFSDLSAEFEALGVTLIGISPDSAASHAKFRAKYGLKTRLAADPEHVAIDAFGLWGEKETFGRAYLGLLRTTVIIAPDGTIADIVPVPRVKGHAAALLQKLRALISES
jgi:thioredoxin-dependent peroxiredoxin